jgi:CheY-like chemotaxis protein
MNLGAPDLAAIRSAGARGDALVSLEGARVLVVDDDDAGRDVVAAHLEARDAKVIGAASADEALAILEREQFDVMLVDIAMPGSDGYELIRTVRGMSPAACATIPAAALTAFARAEDRRKSLESGFQMHLTKPVEPSTLVEAVAALTSGTSGTPGTARLAT